MDAFSEEEEIVALFALVGMNDEVDVGIWIAEHEDLVP